jgi:hypothetical protein
VVPYSTVTSVCWALKLGLISADTKPALEEVALARAEVIAGAARELGDDRLAEVDLGSHEARRELAAFAAADVVGDRVERERDAASEQIDAAAGPACSGRLAEPPGAPSGAGSDAGGGAAGTGTSESRLERG